MDLKPTTSLWSIRPTFSMLVVLAFLLSPSLLPEASAQCAMCRATVESSAQAGNVDAADGLNTGILYLMSLPYILFSVIGFFWYRSTRRKKAMLKAKGTPRLAI